MIKKQTLRPFALFIALKGLSTLNTLKILTTEMAPELKLQIFK